MDIHNSASWTLHRYGDDVIHHVYRRREHGLKDQEDSVGVLDVLLPLGGDHLRGLIGLELLQRLHTILLSAPLKMPLKQECFLAPKWSPN